MTEMSGPRREYEMLLKQLHDLDRGGLLDSEEADSIREKMDPPWRRMSSAEQRAAAALSADLHTLADKPPDLQLSHEERLAAVRNLAPAYQQGDWESLLRLLRRAEGLLPKDRAAYMRGRSWSSLGDWLAGLWFYQEASRCDPDNASFRFLALDACFRAGFREEAMRTAQLILSDTKRHPREIFGAAKVVFDAALLVPEHEAREALSSIVEPLRLALNQDRVLPPQQRIASVTIAAWAVLASALSRLGRMPDARQTYDAAVATFPDSDELLTARALFLLPIDSALAQRDMTILLRKKTRFVFPYLIAAHAALLEERFADCLSIGDEGLQRATTPAQQADFHEWAAIALYELGAPRDDVRAAFENALIANPLSDRIRLNYEVFKKLMTQEPKSPRSTGPKFDVASTVPTPDVMAELTKALRPVRYSEQAST